MKKIILIAISCYLITGCDNWLDVSGKQETREEDLFKTEQGFKSALTGVYVRLASKELYGLNTSYLMPEFLANNWQINPYTSYPNNQFSNFNYTGSEAEKIISDVWGNYYRSVIQLNSILENIDEKEGVFTNGNYELIKGEALALRGFIHFELLRYFGPVPLLAQSSDKAIPYVDQTTTNPTLLLSQPYGDVVSKIERDIKNGIDLLSNDPLTQYTLGELRYDPNTTERPYDSWQTYRQRRMNYYAAKGILSRLHLWTGNKTEAARYAKEILDAENSDGTPKFELLNVTYFNTSSADLVLSPEHLFGTHLQSIEDVGRRYFLEYTQWYTLMQSKEALDDAYESTLNNNDWRYLAGNRIWAQGTLGNITLMRLYKYMGSESFSYKKLVPVMRIAELYLILAECLDWEDGGREYMESFINSRNLSSTVMDQITDELTLRERLEKEYRKEFFAEGQMFAFYKRHNYSTYTWPEVRSIETANYILPKPEGQTIFE